MSTNETRAEIEQLLVESGALQRGHFILSSGLHSDRYCQCAALFKNPRRAERIARIMAEHLGREAGIDVVLAPALGGMLWGYELARALGAHSIFAERKPASGFEIRRGFALEPDERVLLAEDVVTTGASVMELVPLVERAGASVSGIAVIVDRSGGGFSPPVPLHALIDLELQTWPEDALPQHLQDSSAIKPGSRERPTARTS